MIVPLLLTVAGTLAVSHFAPRLWAMLPTTKLIDQFRQMEAEAQPLVQLVEKEALIVRDDLQQKFAAVGAKLTEWKSRAAAAEGSVSDLTVRLDAANRHIAELTAGDAEVESAVNALADQASG